VKNIIKKIGEYPIFEIKKSRALPNIYIKKQSVKIMCQNSALEKHSYKKVLAQLDCLINYIIN